MEVTDRFFCGSLWDSKESGRVVNHLVCPLVTSQLYADQNKLRWAIRVVEQRSSIQIVVYLPEYMGSGAMRRTVRVLEALGSY